MEREVQVSSPGNPSKPRKCFGVKEYLRELAALAGRPVSADELGDPEHAATMRLEQQRADLPSGERCEVAFAELGSEQFRRFVRELHDAHPVPVQIWTPRTIACGVFTVPSIESISFDFDFTINSEGILALATSDGTDVLLLDFSESTVGGQQVQIEIRGQHWAEIRY